MKIGLTTGVFDLFHKGHENVIKKSAKQCDCLFVAVASDWLTVVQKGVLRPIDNEVLRCKNVRDFLGERRICGQAYITDRLDFNDLELIDVFFVGPDQRNVRWNGPRVVVPRFPGVSTGRIIAERGQKT